MRQQCFSKPVFFPFYCYLKLNLFLRKEFYKGLESVYSLFKNTYNPQIERWMDVIASASKLQSLKRM